jgi:glyoxylase-like metal-dependent hydrolase (beta-lactamase superfamily II)
MLELKQFLCNPVFRERCWVAVEGDKALVIDPGFTDAGEFAPFEEFIRKENLTIEAVFITHGHFDHIFGVNRLLDAFGKVPVMMHPEDKELQGMAKEMAALYGENPEVIFDTVDITDGEILEAVGRKWEVIATPGHTKGGVSFYCKEESLLFCGDTLFAGSIGRTDLHGGSYDALIVSIMDRLMGLPGETVVLPGHGWNTTIGDERTHNPFLQPWGEKEQDGIDWDEDGIELHG